jgi:hypothetical protein
MEYQEDYNLEEQQEPAKRPEMLTVLCILSFLNAVYNGIVNFFSFAFYDSFRTMFEQMSKGEGMFEGMEEQLDGMETMLQASLLAFSVGKGYYLFKMLLFVASFVGVLMMWKLQKKGFHVYTIAQFLMLIVTSVFVTSKIDGGFPFGAILWTALFVFMYYTHYKNVMK